MVTGKRCLVNQEEIMQQLQDAVALHNQGELDKAKIIYERLLLFDCTRVEALNRLGVMLRVQGLIHEGRACLMKSLEINDNQSLVWYCLGNSFLQTKEYVEAVTAYRFAQKNGNLNICGFWNNLGKALEGCGDREQAFKCYKNELLVCPDNLDASLTLANRFKERGQIEEAIAHYRRAADAGAGSVVAIECLASSLVALGRCEDVKDVVGLCSSRVGQGSLLHFLYFLASNAKGPYLNAVDLRDPNCIHELKYSLLRKLRIWICVGDWLEAVYDSLYSEMYEAFGIQGLDTTDEVYALKPLQGWLLPAYNSLTFRIYSSRFAVGSDFLRLLGPFSSDINHLSHAGHFYLMLSSRFGEIIDMAGRRVEIKLDYGIDALPSSNLCLGFSARVGDEWRQHERSHAYVELIEESEGAFVADVSSESLKELGVNEDHFTAEKYKLWDPVETAQQASGMFLFLRSPDYPVNPKGSVTIHSFNVI